jgi:hypothetical protein
MQLRALVSSVAIAVTISTVLATEAHANAPVGAPVETPPPVAGERVPMEGVGLLVGGAIAIAGGAGLVGYGLSGCSSTDLVCDPAERRKAAWVGLAFIPAGLALASGGGVLKHRFNAWRDTRKLRVPKRGNGMFVGGGVLVGFGALGFAVAKDSPRAAILGALWTAGGVGLGVGGAVLRVRYGKYKTAHELARRPVIAPMMLARGAGISAVGRF